MASSNQRMGLVSGLLQLLLQRHRSDFGHGGSISSSTKPSALTPERAIGILMGSSTTNSTTAAESFEKHCGVAFNLEGILQVMFTKTAVPRYQQINNDVLLAEKMRTVTELMTRLAKILQRNGCNIPGNFAVSVVDYKFLCRLAESFVRQIDADDSRPKQVTVAMLHVVASVSLLSCYPSIDFDNWSIECWYHKSAGELEPHLTLADNYAYKAINALKEISDETGDWYLSASAFCTALDLYRFQLSCLHHQANGEHSIDLERLQATVEHLSEVALSTSRLATLSKHCVIRVLARLRGHFSLEGEDLYAVQAAKWNVDASMESGQPWFESTVL